MRASLTRIGPWVGVVVAALATAAPALAQQEPRERFDVRVFAPVGPPGYPAQSLVTPDGSVHVGTYSSPECCAGPSKVFRWAPDGAPTGEWTVQGQDPDVPNGVQVAAYDRSGRLYLLDKVGGRAMLLDPATGKQRDYATFADVPTCGGGAVLPCSESVVDNPPQPNYAAWGPDGSLYVTDFQQALIWRVPPHGGAAQVWLTDERLDGLQFGPTGIVLQPDRTSFLLSVFAGRPGPDSLTTGALYTLPLQPDGAPGELDRVWESAPGDGPDGFAVGTSGTVYVALLGPTANAVVALSPDGQELARVPSSPLANAQQEVPFDAPSSVAFLGERLIVTNHAVVTGDEENMVLLDVFASERGQPVFVPASAGPVARPAAAPPMSPAPAPDRRPTPSAPALPVTGPGPLAWAATAALLAAAAVRRRRHRSAPLRPRAAAAAGR